MGLKGLKILNGLIKKIHQYSNMHFLQLNNNFTAMKQNCNCPTGGFWTKDQSLPLIDMPYIKFGNFIFFSQGCFFDEAGACLLAVGCAVTIMGFCEIARVLPMFGALHQCMISSIMLLARFGCIFGVMFLAFFVGLLHVGNLSLNHCGPVMEGQLVILHGKVQHVKLDLDCRLIDEGKESFSCPTNCSLVTNETKLIDDVNRVIHTCENDSGER